MKTNASPGLGFAARLWRWAWALAGAILGFAGCAETPGPRVTTTPLLAPTLVSVPAGAVAPSQPPTVQVAASAPPRDGAIPVMIMVAEPPPAPQREIVTARPTADHVWVAGYWSWCNERYEWIEGRWELPPTAQATWVAPRWEREGVAYRFYAGFWN